MLPERNEEGQVSNLPLFTSVTQITTYLMCPRKYKFRYVEKREPEERRAEMALGSAVHSAIAWWLEARIDGKEPTVEEVLRTFRADWLAQAAPGDLAFDDGDTPEAFQAQGEALVKLFVERFAGETPPTFAERRFEVDLVEPKTGELLPVKLVGYLDFASESDSGGQPTVGEIKTVGRWTSPDQWNLQLAAYSYAMTQIEGTRPRTVLVELVKTELIQPFSW